MFLQIKALESQLTDAAASLATAREACTAAESRLAESQEASRTTQAETATLVRKASHCDKFQQQLGKAKVALQESKDTVKVTGVSLLSL